MNELLQTMLEIQELQLIQHKNPERHAALIALRQKIPPPILAHLDRLLERGKKGVAIVRHGVCSECHMQVPIGVLATIMHDKDIQLCANCGRYVCLPKEELPSTAPAATPPKAKRRKATLAETADVQ